MNKRLIVFILLAILAVLVGINAILHEQAYREQSRTELQQMKLQLQETEQFIRETREHQEKVQQFLDRLNILPEQTVTYYAPYDSRGLCHDGTPDTTATGTKPRPGTFAVDPRRIPLGSHMAVIYPDGTIETGRALDTGGSIKGNRVDAFRWTHDEAMRWGRKEATVVWILS